MGIRHVNRQDRELDRPPCGLSAESATNSRPKLGYQIETRKSPLTSLRGHARPRRTVGRADPKRPRKVARRLTWKRGKPPPQRVRLDIGVSNMTLVRAGRRVLIPEPYYFSGIPFLLAELRTRPTPQRSI